VCEAVIHGTVCSVSELSCVVQLSSNNDGDEVRKLAGSTNDALEEDLALVNRNPFGGYGKTSGLLS
jgi:hypothetical protein